MSQENEEYEEYEESEESAPGGGRTHTWRILSPLPLPLGYRGGSANSFSGA